jgi:hypothetical protein
MPKKYVVEMVMDRIAACKVYDKAEGKGYENSHPYIYFMKGLDYTYLNKKTCDLLKELLNLLANEGEKKMFIYIRKTILKNK